MSEINQPVYDDVMYNLPARVVGISFAGGIFVRLFLGESIEIDDQFFRDKPKNIFLKNAKNENLEIGDFLLVKTKGFIVNHFILCGEIPIDMNNRSVSFVEKLNNQEYKEHLNKNEIIINFNELIELKAKKDSLSKQIEILESNLESKHQQLVEKSKELVDYIDSIGVLKEISDIEQANKFLKQERDDLLSFQQKNQWLEKLKPYLNLEDNISNFSDEPLNKTKSKPLFNKITHALKNRFNLSDDFIYCYLLSLFTSLIQGRFLLLTGHIGTGKSSIIKETGKLMGGQTNMVAVRPAWLDASDLLGYFDPINQRYNSTDFVNFLKKKMITISI